jgi:hypothetical protein
MVHGISSCAVMRCARYALFRMVLVTGNIALQQHSSAQQAADACSLCSTGWHCCAVGSSIHYITCCDYVTAACAEELPVTVLPPLEYPSILAPVMLLLTLAPVYTIDNTTLNAAFATAAEELPAMVLPPLEYPSILAPAADFININSQIMQIYLNSLLPGEAQ